MEQERIYTETEKRILKKRMEKKITPDTAFSFCGVQTLAEVYKDCGGKGTVLYFALIGNSIAGGKGEPFKLFRNTLEATGLNKHDLSRATSQLEKAGYIIVVREPGYKNKFILTPKGRKGLVARNNIL